MTDYTKLVEALRICVNTAFCNECPLFDTCENDNKLKLDAADAIEALQTENTDIREELFVSQRKYDNFVAVASMENAMLARQMPKRGEIVRCGECKHRNDLTPTKWHPCVDMAVNDDWFCADGEREVQE